jgi:squalene-hopene/tetraprenyl-beta-curcumene cyclase
MLRSVKTPILLSALCLFGFLSASLTQADSSLTLQAKNSLQMLSSSLAQKQRPDGAWVGPLEADPTVDLMPLILAKNLGLTYPNLESETLDRIFRAQDSATGLWSRYPGGPATADVTEMILYVLKYVDPKLDENDPRLARAWKWANERGNQISSINRLIAIFGGVFPNSGKIHHLSPMFFDLPSYFPINIENIGFSRAGLVPYLVWNYYAKVNQEGKTAKPLDSARLESAGALFARSGLSFLALHNREFWAQEGLGWILKHQQQDGTWGGAVQMSYFSMIALREAERAGAGDFESQIRKSWEGIMSWRAQVPEGYIFQQSTVGPVMDTARVLSAIPAASAGMSTLSPDKRERAVQWLLDHQILKTGDWDRSVKDVSPGGWTFEEFNDAYPDLDDTAMVIETLVSHSGSLRDTPAVSSAIDRGIRWMLAFQNKDGGFPTWDRGSSKLLDWITAKGIHSLPDVADRSQVDISSRVLRALSAMRDAKMETGLQPLIDNAISKTCSFLLHRRRTVSNIPIPVWRGEWMVNYAYGSSEAMDALLKAGCWQLDDAVETVQWIVSKQDTSGGWGESPESYIQKRYVGAAPSLSQTEFILNSLIDYELQRARLGAKVPSVRTAIDAGIRYLLNAIGDNPNPSETCFTGVLLRGHWYGRYLLLPHYEAVRVLGEYVELLEV